MTFVDNCITSGDTAHYKKARALENEWINFKEKQDSDNLDLSAKLFIDCKISAYDVDLPSTEIIQQWRRAILRVDDLQLLWWKRFMNGYTKKS